MTRRDPGAANGQPINFAVLAPCTCGHIAGVHTSRTPTRRTTCTAADPERCGCRSYQPGPLAEITADTLETTR
jgi:hypothetical protein